MSTSATTADKTRGKVQKLLEMLKDKRSLLVVMQDNPDPDSIASAAALRRLAHSAGDVQCSITYGGVIGRGENKALAEYLGLNFRPIEGIDPTKFDAVALVDTQPQTGNNSLPDGVVPDIVLDHHALQPATRSVPFTDIRSKYGALSTLLFEYLSEAGITPPPPLATALLYAIRTDTGDLGRQARQADVSAIEKLYPLANARMLGEIQQGRVTREYFQTLARGLGEARVLGKCVFVIFGEVPNPDILAELADLLLRYEEAEWSLCCGFCQDKAWVSIRTSQSQVTASDVARKVASGVGTGGGHDQLAGAQIPLSKRTDAEMKEIQKLVRQKFLRAVGENKGRPRKLLTTPRGD